MTELNAIRQLHFIQLCATNHHVNLYIVMHKYVHPSSDVCAHLCVSSLQHERVQQSK